MSGSRDAATPRSGESVDIVDAFDGGFGWQAQPEESLQRASHALATDDGLWLLDPVDAPGLDAELAARSPGAAESA